MIFTCNKSICWNLLRHLRNAIAHVSMTKNQSNLKLTDKYKTGTTMYGNLYTIFFFP